MRNLGLKKQSIRQNKSKILILIVLIILDHPKGYSQIKENKIKSDSILVWHANSKLTALDFRQQKSQMGDSPETVGYSATFISSYYQTTADTVFIRITAKFNKNSSWIDSASSSLLNHEQGHFNIQELEARNIRKSILKSGKLRLVTEADLDSIIDYYYIYFDSVQNRYDIETEHSINCSEQKRWDEFIKSELKKLAFYEALEIKLPNIIGKRYPKK